MSNIKRVSLTSIESNNDKVKTKRKGSFRISIPIIEEPSSKEYSRFNYQTLYKSALDKKRLKKDTNGAQNGLQNGGGVEVEEEGDEDELVKLAKKFEQKYGGTQKKDNYSELGAGYDEEDSFIDNTDAYNDELSEDLLPKHGGYYLNRGGLELQRIDLPEEVIENEEEICRNKIKRTINVIQSSDEEEAESSEAEESGRDVDEDDEEEDEEEDEDEEEPDNEVEDVRSEKKAESKPAENGLSVPSKSANPESILSTIESVIGNHGESHKDHVSVIKKKKKRKREREEGEEGDHHQSKQRKQEREKMSGSVEDIPTPKHHKHAKKHRDKSHDYPKEHREKIHDKEQKEKVHDKEHKVHDKEHKVHDREHKIHDKEHKARKGAGAPTVKELLGERKLMDAMSTSAPASTPTTVWTSPSSNLNDIIESVVRAAHLDPRTVRTPNSCEWNQVVFSEDSVSLSTSEDVDMSDEPHQSSPSDPLLLNGHCKDESYNPSTPTSLTPSLPPTDLKIPETLPNEIRDLITGLKQVANQVTNLSSRKTFPSDVNNLLIDLEAKCRSISSANKNAVYAHLGTFLPLSKDTLIKRARKMSVDKEEEKLEAVLAKIKLKIDSVMPAVLLQYSKDCEIATKKAASEKATDSSGDQKPVENQKPQMPRRLFPWDEQLRSYVREIIDIKATCFRILNCRKDTEEDYIKEYLEVRVKPLWPDGWMRTLVLLREGRSTTSMRSRKYTPKPASKKAMSSQPTQTPQPKPLPPKHKAAETMLLSSKAQTLLSSLAAVNSLSYQKPPEPLPLPPSSSSPSPSLFSQIQSSLSKAPPVQTSSGTNTDSVISPSPHLSSTPPVSTIPSSSSSSTLTVKKPSPPKPSPAHSPHSISNLINTTKAHVSSSKYNYPPEAHTPPSGNSSNAFSVTKPPGDLLPVSTSLSSLLQGHLAYGLCSLPSSSPSLSTTTATSSPLYKLPQFPQPLFSPSASFPHPTPSPPSLPRKSVSPASSPPKKRMSTPSPTLGSDPSNILDLSPASISYSSSKQDRSVSPLNSAKPPSAPLHHDQSTSPVSTKGGTPGGSMLSLKHRILHDAKTPAPSPTLHTPYLDDSAKPPPVSATQSLRDAAVTASSALSQMISDSLLSTPSSISGGYATPSSISGAYSMPSSISVGYFTPSSISGAYSTSHSITAGTPISTLTSAGTVKSDHTSSHINFRNSTASSMSSVEVKSDHTSTSISSRPVKSEYSPASISSGVVNSVHTPASISSVQAKPENSASSISSGYSRSEQNPASISSGVVSYLSGRFPRSEQTVNSASTGGMRSAVSSALCKSAHTHASSALSRAEMTSSISGVSKPGHAKPMPLVTGVYQSHPMNTTIGVSLSVPKSSPGAQPPCSLDLDVARGSEPRQRKSSRSSSKESDGKESEIVADVLKSLMSLNQMSESSGGSPDKSKGFHEPTSGGGRAFTADVNNKNSGPATEGSARAPKILRGFEDEFKRHIQHGASGLSSAPEFPKDMKMKTFQTEQLLMNNAAASEFSMRMPTVVTPSSTPHVTQDS